MPPEQVVDDSLTKGALCLSGWPSSHCRSTIDLLSAVICVPKPMADCTEANIDSAGSTDDISVTVTGSSSISASLMARVVGALLEMFARHGYRCTLRLSRRSISSLTFAVVPHAVTDPKINQSGFLSSGNDFNGMSQHFLCVRQKSARRWNGRCRHHFTCE